MGTIVDMTTSIRKEEETGIESHARICVLYLSHLSPLESREWHMRKQLRVMIKPRCLLKWNASLLVSWFALCTPPEITAFPNICCYLGWESSFSLLAPFHNLGVANVSSESHYYIVPEHSLLFHELWRMEIRPAHCNQDRPYTHNPNSCSKQDTLPKTFTCGFMFPPSPWERVFLLFQVS